MTVKGPRASKTIGRGMVRVTVRLTFPDGSDSYRGGVTDLEHADVLAFRYARALHSGWLAQLVDKELPPDVASADELLIKEINQIGQGGGWKGKWDDTQDHSKA